MDALSKAKADLQAQLDQQKRDAAVTQAQLNKMLVRRWCHNDIFLLMFRLRAYFCVSGPFAISSPAEAGRSSHAGAAQQNAGAARHK